MGFDGLRALFAGDYVTPASGAHAGQLGPWAQLVSQLGVEPRSTGMKIGFVLLSVAGLGASAGFLLRLSWGFSAMAAISIATLWYLPFGTLIALPISLCFFSSEIGFRHPRLEVPIEPRDALP